MQGGRELAKLLPGVNLTGNPPFKGLVEYRKDAETRTVVLGDLKLIVIGPNEKIYLTSRRE